MRKSSALLEDLGQLAGGALSLVSGLRDELKRDMQERLEALVAKLDLVPRKDFERLEAMVMKLRAEQDKLAKAAAPAPKSAKPKTSK